MKEITVLIARSDDGVANVSDSIRGVYSSFDKAWAEATKLVKSYGASKWKMVYSEKLMYNSGESLEFETYNLDEPLELITDDCTDEAE